MLSKTPEDKLKRQSLFLNCYREVGTVRGSCEAMGIDESTVYRWRDDDSFQDKFQLAKRSFADKLENLALNRVEQQKPSDNPTLLIAMLNANRPDKYRPTAHTTDDVEDEAVKTLKDLKRNYQINQQLYEDVVANKYDIAIGNFSVTAERTNASYTRPIFLNKFAIFNRFIELSIIINRL